MRRLNLLLSLLVVLTACGRPQPPSATTPVPLPTIVLPPTWTPTPIEPTPQPSIVPTALITRTLTPPATPAASIIYSSTDGLMALKVPGNWTAQGGHRQLLATTTKQLDYVLLSAPGTSPQPAIIIFYNWPAVEAIDNTNAWQQAYALASLAIKNCSMLLAGEAVGEPVSIAGENAKFVPYTDTCGEQGELIGLVHNNLNIGILIETPQSVWTTWQPILHGIIGSITIKH